MSATIISGAAATLIDDATVSYDRLVVDAGVVVAGVGADATGADVVDATGCVVTPGLVNAHHHLLQSAFRTRPGTRFVPMSTWLQAMGRAYAAASVDPELAAAAAAVGLAESLLNGVTTVADHHLTWPAGIDSVELVGGVLDAARRIGTRLVFVRGTAGDDPHMAARSVVDIHDRWFDGVDGGISADGMRQLAVGPAGVHSDGQDTFAALAEVAGGRHLRRRTQANEQVDVRIAAQRYGRRPLELLDEWGWLDTDVTLAHLCDLSSPELDLLGRSGVSATHVPGCDVPMGWGVSPVADLRARGVRVGLGTSGGGSNDAGHLLADARLGMQVSGLVGAPMAAQTLLGMATEGSAVGLHRTELGHLRAGAAADLCIWDCADVHDAGVADPVDGLLWASPGRRPRDVMVAGRWVVRNAVLQTVDSRHVAADLRAMVASRG